MKTTDPQQRQIDIPLPSASNGASTGAAAGRVEAAEGGEANAETRQMGIPAKENTHNLTMENGNGRGTARVSKTVAPHRPGQDDSNNGLPAEAAGADADADESDSDADLDVNENSADDKSGKKRKVLLILAAIAAVIAIPVGIYMYVMSLHYESTDDAYIEAHVTQVSPRVSGHVQKVLVNDNEVVKAGTVLFELDAQDFQARVDAAEAQLKVAQATADQARIAVEVTSVTAAATERESASGFQAALAQVASSQALLQTSGKKVAEAEAAVATAKARARQAVSAMESAKTEADRLTSDVERTRALYKSSNVAREEYEHAIAAARSAISTFEAARDNAAAMQAGINQAEASLRATSDTVQQYRAQVEASKSAAHQAEAKMAGANVASEKIQGAQAELQTALANVKVAQANLDTARLNLSYTTVRAATDGKVTRKNIEPGNYVAAGQNVMALVQPGLWVVANFKENQLQYMDAGDNAEIEVDMIGGRKFHGHVESVQAGTGSRFSLMPPENATGNFVKVVQRVPVKIVFDDPPSVTAPLAPGLSVVPKVRAR